MKKSLLFFVLFINAVFCCSQNQYFLLYEKNVCSRTGGENLLTLHRAFCSFEDKYIPPKFFKENLPDNLFIEKPKDATVAMGFLYRFGRSFIIDMPVDYLTYLTQHEVFGHGFRMNEFGFNDNSYKIGFIYNGGRGFTKWGTQSSKSRLLTNNEYATVHFSGAQANSILSGKLETKWLLSDSTYYHDFGLYLFSSLDLYNYISTTKKGVIEPSNDIFNYINRLNSERRIIKGTDTTEYSVMDLSNNSKIILANPFLIISAINYCKYLFTGQITSRLYTLRIGECKILPKLNMGLSPFGIEYYFENNIKYKKRLFNIYGRYGNPKLATSWGSGLNLYNIINNKKIYINGCVDIWNQPAMKLSRENYQTYLSRDGFGWAASATLAGKIIKKTTTPVSIVLQAGYKTQGFLQGEALLDGPFFRFGISIENIGK